MRALGRPVHLETSPTLSACLMQRLTALPVVLAACWDGTEVDVIAYTARGLTSQMTCHRALRALEKALRQE